LFRRKLDKIVENSDHNIDSIYVDVFCKKSHPMS
jgi:hypothetical protein